MLQLLIFSILLLIPLSRQITYNGEDHHKYLAASGKIIELRLLFPDRQKQNLESPCLDVKMLIINHTDTAASFFEDWNYWGYFNTSFVVKTMDTTYTLYKVNRDWDKNFPSFKTLFPGDSLLLNFSLGYGSCYNSQFAERLIRSPTMKIKAVYELQKNVLDGAELEGAIKYKHVYINPSNSRCGGSWIIVDSLKNAVEVNRTFPLSKLESKEYVLI